MTIDELDTNTIDIDEVTKLLLATGAFENKDEAKNQANLALELMKELQWWRSQNLIRREDVLNIYNSDLCLDFDREMCESTPNCRCCNIMRIPKAKYILVKDL